MWARLIAQADKVQMAAETDEARENGPELLNSTKDGFKEGSYTGVTLMFRHLFTVYFAKWQSRFI